MSGHHAADVLVDRPGPGIVVLHLADDVTQAIAPGTQPDAPDRAPTPHTTWTARDDERGEGP